MMIAADVRTRGEIAILAGRCRCSVGVDAGFEPIPSQREFQLITRWQASGRSLRAQSG